MSTVRHVEMHSLIAAACTPRRSMSRRARRLRYVRLHRAPVDRILMIPMTRRSFQQCGRRSCLPTACTKPRTSRRRATRRRATLQICPLQIARADSESKQPFQSSSGANGAECRLRRRNWCGENEKKKKKDREVKARYFCHCSCANA